MLNESFRLIRFCDQGTVRGQSAVNPFLTCRSDVRGMKPMILLLVTLLAACASPDPAYFGADRHEITLQGIRFVVFQKDNHAEVIRLGYLSRPARDPVPALMEQAVERTTGCAVIAGSRRTGLPGDTGEARFRLRC